MSEALGIVYPVGMFDLNREARDRRPRLQAPDRHLSRRARISRMSDAEGHDEQADAMATFLSAHGYDPGPSQRPLLAGAISGVLATASGDRRPGRLRVAAHRSRDPRLVAACDARAWLARDGGCRRDLRAAVRPRRQQCPWRLAVRDGLRLRSVGRGRSAGAADHQRRQDARRDGGDRGCTVDAGLGPGDRHPAAVRPSPAPREPRERLAPSGSRPQCRGGRCQPVREQRDEKKRPSAPASASGRAARAGRSGACNRPPSA